mmetsp:Transcript_27273/g.86660  ORF Transcript_27273/g.86660 Transcript_27273/m.86660 type:complete len:203 (+) Transcript_27273:157-765(+)
MHRALVRAAAAVPPVPAGPGQGRGQPAADGQAVLAPGAIPAAGARGLLRGDDRRAVRLPGGRDGGGHAVRGTEAQGLPAVQRTGRAAPGAFQDRLPALRDVRPGQLHVLRHLQAHLQHPHQDQHAERHGGPRLPGRGLLQEGPRGAAHQRRDPGGPAAVTRVPRGARAGGSAPRYSVGRRAARRVFAARRRRRASWDVGRVL